MKVREDSKIMLYGLVGSLVFWVADAAIDSWFFSQGPFVGSLLGDMSSHELFFRIFMVLTLLLFALLASHITKKRRRIEERYKNLVELSSDIIYASDKEGKQRFMNDAAYRVLERSPNEVIGKPMIELIHPDDRERTLQKRREMAEFNTDTFNFENRYLTKSGKTIPVLHNIRVLKNEKGEFIGTQGIARDITERKQAEDELKKAIARIEEEKARSEGILAAIGDGLSIQDKNLKIIFQNETHKEIAGGDKVGQFCYLAYSRSDKPCPDCPVLLSFNDGMIHTHEKPLVRDPLRYIEIKSSPLRDASGKIIACIEAVRDITERKKTEERVTLFSEAVEEAMDGIQLVDLNGYIVYSNKAVQEIYGFSPQELKGKHVNDMNADKQFAERVILPALRETGRWMGEVMVVHKDGTVFPVWLSTSLVKDQSGKPISMIGMIRDITDRKRSEEVLKRHREQLVKLVEERTQELSEANKKLRKQMDEREKMEEELLKAQKLESLGILAGGIAHDFNNLLASMLGNISLAMLDIDRSHPGYDRLAAAEKASLRAQELTRQLLTFSRGGAPVKKTIDLKDVVREASGFALRGSRVKCEIFMDGDIGFVDADEGQISQVIHNLIINADQAMPEGGTIAIRCSNIQVEPGSLPLKEGAYVRISIDDHGTGIPKEYHAKIFDPYFTTKQKGSGLGLATCYSIIKKHDGHISVESRLGKGTTFHVHLPASKQKVIMKKPEETNIQKGMGTVLVMDDEAEIRETTGKVLLRLGYTVDYATDGKEAIELYRRAKESGKGFDLVIMDLTVPGGMGGKEAIRKLREIDPGVKAIVSSGYSNDPIMADFRTFGFAGVVTKPFRLKDFSEEVHRVMTCA